MVLNNFEGVVPSITSVIEKGSDEDRSAGLMAPCFQPECSNTKYEFTSTLLTSAATVSVNLLFSLSTGHLPLTCTLSTEASYCVLIIGHPVRPP